MPRRRRPDPPLPPGLIEPDFLARHGLWQRLYVEPLFGLTPRHAWAPMTDAEWAALAPHLAALGCGLAAPGRAGERMEDPRGRLDAIFRAVMLKRSNTQGGGRAPWSALPEAFGKHDTVARTWRRWAHRGLWLRLLEAVADPAAPAALRALTYRVCCCVRRGLRIMGLKAIVLARRLKLHSALPAPSQWLPDPDLSAIYTPLCIRLAEYMRAHPDWRPPRYVFRLMRELHRFAGGRTRISRSWEPA
ncbi:transposase [Paracraurococcus lichenis]|uniref:Transposase n=1 Tax=Paracraurococcus lichenis TaxID=3064888 RepID=A0ABT9DV32_9PROT|nr:transposase [Paracraurococcus sp. LOR1-02]MDO9707759.1 transposase [Paracraurococcus sp. LOR1-02]